MPQPPRISDAEWTVMKELWKHSPQTALEVTASLHAQTSWSPSTVKTLINRLVGKGALGSTKQGREYLYVPKVSESSCVRAESRSFLQRVFGGSMRPMLASLLEEESLSPEDIQELRRLLDRKEAEDRHA